MDKKITFCSVSYGNIYCTAAVWFFEPSNQFGSRATNMAAENSDRNSKFLLYQTIRWTVYGSLFVGYSSYYFCRKSYTFAIPALIGELNLKKNELGVITSGFCCHVWRGEIQLWTFVWFIEPEDNVHNWNAFDWDCKHSYWILWEFMATNVSLEYKWFISRLWMATVH